MEGSTLPREAEGLFRNRELKNIEGIKNRMFSVNQASINEPR